VAGRKEALRELTKGGKKDIEIVGTTTSYGQNLKIEEKTGIVPKRDITVLKVLAVVLIKEESGEETILRLCWRYIKELQVSQHPVRGKKERKTS